MTQTPETPWAAFIEPDRSIQNHPSPHEPLSVPIFSGYRAYDALVGSPQAQDDPLLKEIVDRVTTSPVKAEEQCSAKYYADVYNVLKVLAGQYNRVAEVGVFMGGSSVLLARLAVEFDFQLDLVDISPNYLRFTYERIRRTFPEAIDRVRIFNGGVPEYVKTVLLEDPESVSLVHHDGAHDFNQVVRDLSALSFVKERLHSVILQDTHLRGRAKYMNFVDAAVYAVFGPQMQFAPIGAQYSDEHTDMLTPNPYQGNYFLPGRPEGMFLPMDANVFEYPHPSLKIEEFLDPKTPGAVAG
jgi:hypothetical protein